MITRQTPSADGDRSAREFRTTRWTKVRRAQADSPEGVRALSELCDAYYAPVVSFLECQLRDVDLAREVAHEFFSSILAGGAIAHAGVERGRFRAYLLGAVKHFVSHRREASRRLKRGGGQELLSLDEPEAVGVADSRGLSPDAAFDRQWALTTLARALDAIRAESAAAGRGDFFESAKPWLTGEASHGDQTALAARLDMDPGAFKVAIHRLKRRFRMVLKEEVAGTLEDPAAVEAELQALFGALGG